MSVEQRDVHDFDTVVMQDVGTLVITQGKQESLTVDTELDLKDVYTEVHHGVLTLRLGRTLLDRLSTALEHSLTSPRVHYRLGIKQLRALTVAGAGRVECAALHTQSLGVTLAGVGDVSLQGLAAQELNVELTGSGRAQVAGKAEQQRVRLSGLGSYEGTDLQSQRARVHISGMGRATVWAEQEIDANLSGMGSIEYRGNPQLKQRRGMMGSITHVGNGQRTTTSGPDIRPPRPPKPPFARG